MKPSEGDGWGYCLQRMVTDIEEGVEEDEYEEDIVDNRTRIKS